MGGVRWPQVYYPEMYILEKGYSTFFKKFPELCVGGYRCQDRELY